MKKETKVVLKSIGLGFILLFALLGGVTFIKDGIVRSSNEITQDTIKGSNLQLCPESTITQDIICYREPVSPFVFSIINLTQEELDETLKQCKTWKVIEGKHCINDYRLIIKGEN